MEAEPLDPKELHAFTDSMLPGCFHLLDELPDTVYRLCDLLMTAIKRSGPEYRDLILGQVVHQVSGINACLRCCLLSHAYYICLNILVLYFQFPVVWMISAIKTLTLQSW